MRNFLVFTLLVFICACSSQPIPQWKDTSSRQLENYKINFLAGNEDATEPHFAKAKKAISSNNNLDILAVAYLTKYALHTAALEDFDDSEFLRIDKLQPDAARRAYFDLLKGNFGQIEPDKLPASYSKLLPLLASKNVSAALREITAIDDPLSQLIACGVCAKYLPPDEGLLQLAINTAAGQGWRRPLWAYLSRLQKYYLDHGETIKAENIRERLELLKK